jgi:quercetin dioxygenase-like cupin family protein
MTGTLMAQQPPRVTALMSRDLTESPGRDVLMITVEYAPGGADPVHRHNAHGFIYVLEGSVLMQVKGGKQLVSRYVVEMGVRGRG